MPYANNKGTDQSVHSCSLISTFVFRCLESIIPLGFRILAGFCGWAGCSCLILLHALKDRLYCLMALIEMNKLHRANLKTHPLQKSINFSVKE